MIIVRGTDMWSAWDETDLFLVTTNSERNSRGELVMGRGIARQARDRFPGLALTLGRRVAQELHGAKVGLYALLVSDRWPKAKLGAFQVKYGWAEPARLDLIGMAADSLFEWCRDNPTARVSLNFPGIGNGGLDPHDVMPSLIGLTDNVRVFAGRREVT